MSKVLIVGGGAAGMMAAIFAAYNGKLALSSIIHSYTECACGQLWITF